MIRLTKRLIPSNLKTCTGRFSPTVNSLFMHEYTKIEYVERDLKVSRLTAAKSLEALAAAGFVQKVKVGRLNDYIHVTLNAILTASARDWPVTGPTIPPPLGSVSCKTV